MNREEQQQFPEFAASLNVASTDCVDLDNDTLEEAKGKVSGLSAGADHFKELVQKEFPDFGR